MRALLAFILFFGDLHYRWIGPAVMGGRLDAIAGVAANPSIVYLGHSSGGLWRSTDGGLTFSSAFEAGSGSAVGAIAVDPKNWKHVFIGTGEPFPRNTAEAGDGIWTTRDAGAHWRHIGLARSGSIARILIDPAHPDIVLAAAMGSEFAPNAERGIYRSTDGGRDWTRTLFVNATTGGSDLAVDPKHPNIVYAGMYDYLRRPWTFRSGGPGSGLFVSRDSGKTWTRLTRQGARNGLPSGTIDRVGVSVCASDPRTVYAFVPTRAGLLYRSTDGGAHWHMQNADESIDFRPFYFSQVRCDPRNPRRVYALASEIEVSNDAGRTFRAFDDGGGDNHDLWIDPLDPQRLLSASDMGFRYSVNRGGTWNNDNVVPFAQIYRAGFDNDEPYHVMGGMQDHEVWWGPSGLFNTNDGVSNGDWVNIAGWGDGQYAAPDPKDSGIVYEDTHFGDLAKVDVRTGQRQYISPFPVIPFGGGAQSQAYRFNWSAPLLVSKFDSKTIYFGGNVLFRSADAGATWSIFSPDLTQCDPSQLGPSGGPIWHDSTNAETFCTIYAIAEGHDPRTIWYGTDNGHLEVTRDGAHWTDVIGNLGGLPLPATVSSIASSSEENDRMYVSFDRHAWNDDTPYMFTTGDGGRTWASIANGLTGYVHAVRPDPVNPQVIYAGTERGVFVSFDRGVHWTGLGLGLPHIPVYDLQIQPRDNDLIVATHGRGFYVLDDLTPLQNWPQAVASGAYLFKPVPAVRYQNNTYHEHGRGAFVAENKPYGALISLYLRSAPPKHNGKSTIKVHVYSGSREIDTFEVPAHAGLNRFAWDLGTNAPGPIQDPRPYYVFYPMAIAGPQVLPGTYTLAVDAANRRLTVPVTVVLNPHETATAPDLQKQYDALERLAFIQERAQYAIARLQYLQRSAGARAQIAQVLDRLRNPDPSGYRSPARLTEQIAYLRIQIAQYDGAPTQAQDRLIDEYAKEMDGVDRDMQSLHAKQ